LDFAVDDVVLSVSLNGSKWRAETIPFIDQAMSGTQSWNPFAFDAQKEVSFAGVALTAQHHFQQLEIFLRKDVCIDVRGDELVVIVLGTDYFQPLNDSATYDQGAKAQLVVSFMITENPTHTTRRRVGLAISIIVTVLLIGSGLLGNPGISLLTFCEFQLINIIGRQSCSRGVIAAYFDDAFWVVMPTLKSAAFDSESLGSDFGVILVHTIVALLFFSVFVIASRLRKRVRMLFPSLPLGLVYILFIGATNAAWRSAIHSQKPGPAVGSMILWTLYFLAVAATVWRIRSPRGLLFLRYHRGLFSTLLRGTHSPLQLRGKYSLMIDLWHESFVQFASPIHLLHLSISSIVSAFSSGSPLLCFPVLGTQLVWQSLVFLMTLFALPGRSPFHNGLLVLHASMPLLIIVAGMGSLDCLQAKHFFLSEVLTILSLVGYFLSAMLQLWMSFVERRYRVGVEQELKDITAKHRRIVFFMDDVKSTDQRERLPPISRHFIPPKMVDPDWRSKRHQDMFSFPMLKEGGYNGDVDDGDAWSSRQTGTTKVAAGDRSNNRNDDARQVDTNRWSTYVRVDRGSSDNDVDIVDGEEMDERAYSISSANRDPLPMAGGVAMPPVDAGGSSKETACGPPPNQWVSTRFDGLTTTALRPLASQLRFNPSSPFSLLSGGGDQNAQSPAQVVMGRHEHTPSQPTTSVVDGDERLRYASSPPHEPTSTTDFGVEGRAQRVAVGEHVSRCLTCRRWIITQEGCEVCGLA
jgi:hypothetical protein